MLFGRRLLLLDKISWWRGAGTGGSPPSSLTIILFLLFGFNVLGSDGLKEVKLESSGYVRRGEDLRLKCTYDKEQEIYAVKWYRGSEEFYRYLPKEYPPRQVFPIIGISVDVNSSDDHFVILKNASSATNGKYKCVVSAEEKFKTLYDAKDITVVAIGYDSPKLHLEQPRLRPGQVGRANCTLEKTSPPANITWYINDKQVDPAKIQNTIVKDPLDETLSSTISLLTFPVNTYSPMSIRCTGELFSLYNESSVTRIQPEAPMINYASNYGGVPDTLQRFNATRGSAKKAHGSQDVPLLSCFLTAQLVYFFFT